MASRRSPEERSRQRFLRRQWARRWVTWRYLAVAVVVLGVIGGGVYAVYFSPALSVQGVEVLGEDTVSQEEVLRFAAVPTGGPLATADLAAIKRRVENIDAVLSADVSRRWPQDVRIEVQEREPVAVVEQGGAFVAIDDSGQRFNSYRRAPAGLPRIQAADVTDSEALTSAALVLGSLSAEVRAIVDHLEVDGIDEIELVLADDRTIRWGSAASSEQKAEVLVALLDQPGTRFDVSVPSQPTTSD